MNIHLIAIKISIIGRSNTQIHSKSRVGQHFDPMTHHTHFVQRGLSVKQNQISIVQVAFYCIAWLQMLIRQIMHH